MIKDQIQILIESYKVMFEEETGIPLIAFPDTKLKLIPLKELYRLAKVYYRLDPLTKTRQEEYLIPRMIMMTAAQEMGYSYTDIAKLSGWDRSSVIMTMRSKKMLTIGAKENYEKYRQYIKQNS